MIIPSRIEPLVEAKYRTVTLIITIWFTAILSTIEGVFIYSLFAGSANQSALSMFGTLLAVLFLLIPTCFSWLGLAAALSGKREIYTGLSASLNFPSRQLHATEVARFTFCGIEIARAHYGPWRDLPVLDFPTDLPDLPWSWIAFDNKNAPLSEGKAEDILEAAIWSLLARKILTLKIREETASLPKGIWEQSKKTKLYVHLQDAQANPLGSWEGMLLRAIRERKAPLELYEWIGKAYETDQSDPFRYISLCVEKEYIALGLGEHKGRINKKFQYLHYSRTAEHVRPWQLIRNYIQSHNTVEPRISEMLHQRMLKAIRSKRSSD